jgi:uncharacterized protein YukE
MAVMTVDATGVAGRLELQAARLESLASALAARSRALPRASPQWWRGLAHAAFEVELALFDREVAAVLGHVQAAAQATRRALETVGSGG